MKPLLKYISIFLISSSLLAACAAPQAAAELTKTIPGASAPVVQQTQVPVTGNSQNQQVPSSEAVAALEGVYEQVYKNVNPSVVNIQVQQTVSASGSPAFDFFGQKAAPQNQIQQGLGSGFVWDTQGHIVTNNHVIEGADKVTVTFTDGTTVAGQVVGADANSDLAVVKVDAPANLLKPVTMSDTSVPNVGQMAIAIGNPFGLEGSMTVGIISAVGRSLPVNLQQSSNSPSYTIPDIIQTDAPINPGNSGGVLLDNTGKVIGVTAAIESPVGTNAGIGFAIPASMVQRVVPDLIKNGKHEYTWMGLSGMTLTSDIANQMGLDPNQHGILVGDVTSGGPAEKAGIKGSTQQVTIGGLPAVIGGDVIVKIDGQDIKTFDDMVSYLVNSTTVGQKVTLSIIRDKKQQDVSVTLETRPNEAPVSAIPSIPGVNPGNPNPGNPNSGTPGLPPNHPQIGQVYLGISGADLTPQIAQSLNLDPSLTGVVVLSVAQGSPAADAGLQPSTNSKAGDIITGVDNQKITGISDLQAYLAQKQSGDKITLTVIRNGKETSVDVTLATR
jgi:serine protease Do